MNKFQPTIAGRKMSFNIPSAESLKVVGDKIEVEYTIKNESNYNALIAVPTVESSESDFLEYLTVTHARTENLVLGVNETSIIQKLTLTLKKAYADTTPKSIQFTVSINATAESSNTIGNGSLNNNIISFYIDDVEYKAIEGMTWEEWCLTNYNTLELYTVNAGITDGNLFINELGNIENGSIDRSEVINAGSYYELGELTAPLVMFN